MQTFRRSAAILIFPAIAWLGAACERETATGARLLAAVGGPTCNVPADYPTIQDAVNASGCSTIDVAPGVYAENVTIPRTLTLNGAQAGNPVAGRTFASGFESTVTGMSLTGSLPVFKITATNVTIDGFSVTNPLIVSGAAFGIGTGSGTGSGAVITNNIIHNVITLDPTNNGGAQAIYLQNGPDNVSILGNDIDNVRSNKSAKGVFIGDAASMDASTNILIQGNSITNITSVQVPPSTTPTRGAYGILINNGGVSTTCVGNTMNSGLEIRNNTISTLSSAGGWVHAIGLEAKTPGVVVNGNSISNLAPSPGVTIAVWFECEQGTSFATGHVNENNLDVTILNFGIAVDPALSTAFPTLSVDGTCNWWGDPNGPGPVGPGAGSRVSPNVTYSPWLIAPAPSGRCLGGVASTPGKVTGGGQVDGDPVFAIDGVLLSLPALVPSLADPQSQASFGFVVQQATGGGTPTGNLEYNDKAADVRIKATSYSKLIIGTGMCGPNTHATILGMAAVIRSTGTTNESLTVDVDDCGNPGSMDKFGIMTDTYSNEPPQTLIGGNIQIH
jgi:hypothetical protein